MKYRGLIAAPLVLFIAVSGCTKSSNTDQNSDKRSSFTTNRISLELPYEWNNKVENHDDLLTYEDVVLDGDHLVIRTSLSVSHFPKQGGEVDSIEQIRINMEELANHLRDNGGDVTINTEIKEGQSNGIAFRYLEASEEFDFGEGGSMIEDWVFVHIPEYNCSITFINSFQTSSESSQDKLGEFRETYETINDQFRSILQSMSRADY